MDNVQLMAARQDFITAVTFLPYTVFVPLDFVNLYHICDAIIVLSDGQYCCASGMCTVQTCLLIQMLDIFVMLSVVAADVQLI